jgi:hypothetical protein
VTDVGILDLPDISVELIGRGGLILLVNLKNSKAGGSGRGEPCARIVPKSIIRGSKAFGRRTVTAMALILLDDEQVKDLSNGQLVAYDPCTIIWTRKNYDEFTKLVNKNLPKMLGDEENGSN